MSDARLFELLDRMADAPSFVDGRMKLWHLGDRVVEARRIGKGQRWEWAPSSGVYPADRLPVWIVGPARVWCDRARRMDWAAYLRARGARTL